jgi:hypothetical protein
MAATITDAVIEPWIYLCVKVNPMNPHMIDIIKIAARNFFTDLVLASLQLFTIL